MSDPKKANLMVGVKCPECKEDVIAPFHLQLVYKEGMTEKLCSAGGQIFSCQPCGARFNLQITTETVVKTATVLIKGGENESKPDPIDRSSGKATGNKVTH